MHTAPVISTELNYILCYTSKTQISPGKSCLDSNKFLFRHIIDKQRTVNTTVDIFHHCFLP